MAGLIAIKKIETTFLTVLALGVILLGMQYSLTSFNREEGAAAYVAQQTYHGSLPYRDTFDTNQPFYYYIYRAAFDCFGVSVTAVRIFSEMALLFTIIMVYIIGRVFAGPAVAMLAALLYALFQHGGYIHGYAASAGLFAQLPLLLMLLFIMDREKNYEHVGMFLAGFFGASAFYIKMSVWPALLAMPVYILFHPDTKKSGLKYLLWFIGGALVMDALALGWCIKNNVLGDYARDVLAFTWNYPAQGAGIAREVFGFMKENLLLAAAIVYALVTAVTKFKDGRNFAIAISALAIILGAAEPEITGGMHWPVLVPFLSLLAAYMAKDIFAAVKGRAGQAAAVISVIVVISAGIFTFERSAGVLSRPAEWTEETGVTGEAAAIAARVNSLKEKGSGLFVWANEPEIYFLTGMRPASGYICVRPLAQGSQDEQRVINAFYAKPADFFVSGTGDTERFKRIISEKYNIIFRGRELVLYGKKEDKNEKNQ
jgi:hypothetical protein